MAFLLVILTILPGIARADDLCKGIKVVQDPYTRSSRVDEGVGIAGPSIKWKVKLEANKAELTVPYSSWGAHQVALASGFTMMVLLEDESVLNLASSAEAGPTITTAGAYGPVTHWQVTYPLDKETVTKLSMTHMVSARAQLPTEEYNWAFTPLDHRKFDKLFICVASLMP